MKRSLLLLFLSVFVFIACQKEEVPPIPGPDPIELDLGSLTTASAYGLITDESGNPVAEAIVTLGNKTTVSDANGVFRIQNAQVRENLTQVKVEKSGYFFGGVLSVRNMRRIPLSAFNC
ncbi:MAG: carboxypeptidase regulatory-like domain-containing protein [Saprospirales bacterium]|nr:carboxypeptidase regulatory-like domain-containing protein [Saprospirales bacterium]